MRPTLPAFVFAWCLVLAAGPGASPSAAAQSLPIVQASPSVYCIFSDDVDCAVPRTDTQATFTLDGTSGYGVLHTSTFPAAPGSAAAGWWGFEYRLDLTNVQGVVAANCVNAMRVPLGGVSILFDYDGNGTPGEQVYLTGPGTTAPTLALRSGADVTFYFDPPVCAGETSVSIGITAGGPPRGVLADLQPAQGSAFQIGARAPKPGATAELKFSGASYLVAILPPGGIIGPTPKIRDARRRTMLTNIESARALVAAGRVPGALKILRRLRSLADGVPPDWVHDDPGTRVDERAQLHDALQDTIDTVTWSQACACSCPALAAACGGR